MASVVGLGRPGVLLVAVAVAKYGIGAYPQWVVLWDVADHWQDPRSANELVPGSEYLLGNSLGAILSGMVGAARSRESYGFFHTGLTLFSIVLPFVMPSVRENAERARLLFVLLAGGPVVGLLMLWIGGYDPMTVIAITLIALGRSPRVMMLGWFVFAVNHWTMSLLAIVAWIPVVWFVQRDQDQRVRVRTILLALGSMIAGSVAIHLLLRMWGAEQRRVSAWDLGYFDEVFFRQYLTSIVLIVASVYGVGWVVVLLLARGRAPAARLLVLVSLVATVLIQFPARDATRDTALTLLPALLVVAVAATRDGGVLVARRWWWVASAVVIAAPTLVVFGWHVTWLGWGLAS